MAIICMVNMKGGVSKTSTTYHLAGTLAAMGRRILLVDGDPQSSLTAGFWGPAAASAMDPAATIAALFDGSEPPAYQVVHVTGIKGIDIIPGSMAAADYNIPRPFEADERLQFCLATALADISLSYDLVLIDGPPNLALCSWAAAVASTHLLCPLQAEDFGSQGLSPLMDLVQMVQAGPNPQLRILGLLVSMYNARLQIHQLYDNLLRERYGDLVLSSRIPYATDAKEAVAKRVPISSHKPKGATAKAFRDLADEVLARIDGASGEMPATINQPATEAA
jgi:chromosome partitioning protein